MATELHDKLTFIYNTKTDKILPENIKKGVQIFDVEGIADVLDTSDANATAGDLLQGKIAYTQGEKIEGTIPSLETLTITPKLDEEINNDYNAYVQNIKIPSLLDAAEEYSKVSYKYGSMAGGARVASVTAQVNTVPGGLIICNIYRRNQVTLSTSGWTYVCGNSLVTTEGWYQYIDTYVKIATGTTEKLVVTAAATERTGVNLLSYDGVFDLEQIYSYSTGTSQVSTHYPQITVQPGDIAVGQNFWSSSGVWFNAGSYQYQQRCSDGGRLNVCVVGTTYANPYWSLDTSQFSCYILRPKMGITSNDIKMGRKILGITGTFTEDATVLSDDITAGKIAYGQGQQIIGTLTSLGDEVQVQATKVEVPEDDELNLHVKSIPTSGGVLSAGSTYEITANGNQVLDAVGLAPEFIRAGVKVLGIEGTFGDTSKEHEWNAKYETSGRTSNLSVATMITEIRGMNLEGVTSANGLFYGLSYLKGLPEMNLDTIANGQYMCMGCSNLTYVPNYSMPSITTLHNGFNGCVNLTGLNIANTNKLTDIQQMCNGCVSLHNLPNMNYSAVNNSYFAFYRSGIGGHLDLMYFGNGKTGSTQTSAFQNCQNITGISNLGMAGGTALYRNMMFANCTNLTRVDNCQFLGMNHLFGLFHNCVNLEGVYNTTFNMLGWYQNGYYSYAGSMFYNCYSLKELPELFWNQYNSSNWSSTFYNCSNLVFPENLVCNVMGNNQYSYIMAGAFTNCHKLTNIYINFPNLYSYAYNGPQIGMAFNNCTNLHTITYNRLYVNRLVSPFGSGTCYNCMNLTNIVFLNVYYNNTYSNTNGANYSGLAAGTGITSINNIVGLNWKTTKSANYLFANCFKLHDLGAEELNLFNTTQFCYTFANCHNLTNLTQSQINLNGAYNMCGTFYGFTALPVFENWVFPAANNIDFIFANSVINRLNNISFNVAKSANYMFANAKIEQIGNVSLPNIVCCHNMFAYSNILDYGNLSMPNANVFHKGWNNANVRSFGNFEVGANVNLNYAFDNMRFDELDCGNTTLFTNMYNGCWAFQNAEGNLIHNMNLRLRGYAQLFMYRSRINHLRDIRITSEISNGWVCQTFYSMNTLKTVTNIEWLGSMMNAYNAFSLCPFLQSVNNVGTLTAAGSAGYMFAHCYNLEQVTNLHLPTATSISGLFYNCQKLSVLTNLIIPNLSSYSSMFSYCNKITALPAFNCDLVTTGGGASIGPMGGLTDFGGFTNLGKGFPNTAAQYNYYYNTYINQYPNLTQASLHNIVDNLYQLGNYQNIFFTNNQWSLMDADHRSLVSTKHWRRLVGA